MGLASLVFALRRFLPRFAGVVDIHAARQTQFILQRERSRADRSGKPLSVISFALRCPEEARDSLPLLVKLCKTRFRATDEIGWLDKQCVCAIMPCTGAEGAWKVVDDICRSFPDHITPPHCAVHTFLTDPAKKNNQTLARIVGSGNNIERGQINQALKEKLISTISSAECPQL